MCPLPVKNRDTSPPRSASFAISSADFTDFFLLALVIEFTFLRRQLLLWRHRLGLCDQLRDGALGTRMSVVSDTAQELIGHRLRPAGRDFGLPFGEKQLKHRPLLGTLL